MSSFCISIGKREERGGKKQRRNVLYRQYWPTMLSQLQVLAVSWLTKERPESTQTTLEYSTTRRFNIDHLLHMEHHSTL